VNLRKFLAAALRNGRQALRDFATNRKYVNAGERMLVIRQAREVPGACERGFLTWLEVNLPEVRARIELHSLPYRVRDWTRYRLHIPWFQDPVQQWSGRTFRRANLLAAECDRHGIPVLNRVDRLVNAAKLSGSERIRSAGLRTPVMTRIEDIRAFRSGESGPSLPLIVREDWGHGTDQHLVTTPAELQSLDIESMERPIAVEFIDVRSPEDHLVRKYRYVVAGEVGVPLSMHICESWCTRGRDHRMRHHLMEEEQRFGARASEHASLFLVAREALGLDFVAFDFAYDRDGAPVVWEANPYPFIQISTGRGVFRAPAVVRVFAAQARLYLRAAGFPIPAKVDELLAHPAVFSL
jgi:hypothetical protein